MLPSYCDLIKTYKILPSYVEFKVKKRGWFSSSDFYLNLAYFVSKVMGDGHLAKNLMKVCFLDKDEKDLILIKYILIKTFKITSNRMKIIPKIARGFCYMLVVDDPLFARLLYSAEAPKGNKVKSIFSVPNWILNKKEYRRLFLQGLFEDELTTIKIEEKNYAVSPKLKMAKASSYINHHLYFMNQVRSIVQSFSVDCGGLRRIKNGGTSDVYFSILRNKRNILRFKKILVLG